MPLCDKLSVLSREARRVVPKMSWCWAAWPRNGKRSGLLYDDGVDDEAVLRQQIAGNWYLALTLARPMRNADGSPGNLFGGGLLATQPREMMFSSSILL